MGGSVSRPLRIGHRGAAGYAPENTLSSVQKAIALGVDLVEVDVQRTQDGHLVILHDKRVDRITDGVGYASAMTLEEIRSLKAGNGQKIPTLEEILDLADGRAGLILEMISEGMAEELCDRVRARGFASPVIYASFLHCELLKVRCCEASAKTMALLEGIPVEPASFAIDAKVTHVGLAIDSISPRFVNVLQSAGLQVFVYTVNDPLDIQWIKSLGVDGIISDFPDRVS